MAFDRTQKSFQELARRIKRDERGVVPFVGAGLSAFGDPEHRLPLWRDYLRELLREAHTLGLAVSGGVESTLIEEMIEGGQHIPALDHLVQILGERHFRRVTTMLFDTTGKDIPLPILELVCISWRLIVTTNLDRFLERALVERQTLVPVVITHQEIAELSRSIMGLDNKDHPTLAKLHGTIERSQTWVC
jgi:hypothetical protein